MFQSKVPRSLALTRPCKRHPCRVKLERAEQAAEAEPAYNRFKRMEAAGLASAEEQGEQSHVGPDDGLKAKK